MSEIPTLNPVHRDPLPDRGLAVPYKLMVLALPIIASMVSRTAMSFVDFWMVSEISLEAKAAVMPAGMLLFLVVGFGMGSLSAVSTFVSQSLGRGRLHDCGAYAWQGLYLSIFMGVIFIPAWPLIPGLFAWIGHDPLVQEMEVAYTQIGLLSIAPMLAHTALSNFFNGIHKPSVGFWAMLVANIFNVFGNWVLIYGNLGFPEMGIAGAATATAIAGVLQATIMLAWMLLPTYARQYATRRAWRIDLSKMKALMWFGTPAGAQFTVDIFSWTIFTLFLVGQFGTNQLAAHNTVFKMLEVAFMPVYGLSVAVTAVVGTAIGEGRRDLARLYTRWGLTFALIYMAPVALSFLVFRYQWPTIFPVGEGEDLQVEVIEWAARLLILCAIFELFDALTLIYAAALRGAGDNHWPLYAFLILGFGGFLPGGFLVAYLRPDWGSVGPWAVASVYIIVLGLTLTARWVSGRWEHINLFRHETQAAALAD